MSLQLNSWLSQGNEQQFEQLFRTEYQNLVAYALRYLPDTDEAEEKVQEVFVKLWENRQSLDIKGSVASYLYASVRNACLNDIKHRDVVQKHKEYILHVGSEIEEEESEEHRMISLLEEAISTLPDKCQQIFRLNKLEEKKYREIAEELDISVKTVENQMGKALKLIREQMRSHAGIAMSLVFRLSQIFYHPNRGFQMLCCQLGGRLCL